LLSQAGCVLRQGVRGQAGACYDCTRISNEIPSVHVFSHQFVDGNTLLKERIKTNPFTKGHMIQIQIKQIQMNQIHTTQESNCLTSVGVLDSVPRGTAGPITTAWLRSSNQAMKADLSAPVNRC
jgi:hypothetical protein